MGISRAGETTCQFLPRCIESCRRGLAIRILSVRLFVCPSDKRVDCDKKTEERSVHIFIPYERTFSLVIWGKDWLVGATLYLKFWVNQPPLERNRP